MDALDVVVNREVQRIVRIADATRFGEGGIRPMATKPQVAEPPPLAVREDRALYRLARAVALGRF